jgi:hypothetical protein
VSDPTYDDSSTTSLSYPWRFNFKKNSCACMRGDYTFEIALTGVSLVWGQVGVVSALGESMTCPAIAFAPCSESSEGIDMSSTRTYTPSTFISIPCCSHFHCVAASPPGVCPLADPLGKIDPSTDDCTTLVRCPTTLCKK